MQGLRRREVVGVAGAAWGGVCPRAGVVRWGLGGSCGKGYVERSEAVMGTGGYRDFMFWQRPSD